jgi:dTDP-4-amino-4,6-dideoxygalactose transaminase
MMALGIQADDEVITTPFTFAATAEMIVFLGAIPIYVDLNPRTYNLDPAQLEKAITAKNQSNHTRQPLWAVRRYGYDKRNRRQIRPAGH